MKASVLVSHPHAATVSCATASALESAGRLCSFVTGVAAAPGTRAGLLLDRLAQRYPVLVNRLVSGIPAARLKSLGAVELLARGLSWAVGAGKYDALFVLHDFAVSRCTWPSGADTVYAYEDGALLTFRRAAQRDMMRVWDLPLPHWRTLEAMWLEETKRWPGAMGSRPPLEPPWKKHRKDAELALADVVSVASSFTRSSLEAYGARKPILVTPYGFPVDRFGPKKGIPDGPFTVLSVGTHDLRKGTPYLLEAWKRAGIAGARLRLIGPIKLTPAFLSLYAGLFEAVPHVPRAQLPSEYQSADLLAFPTLGDGFGLVIQEAMCCGTPVITTRRGGGPECITDGQDGWLVPERDVNALVDVLRAASRERDSVHRMGIAARARAERWTWKEAGLELVRNLDAAGVP